jgi:hypothetical protein
VSNTHTPLINTVTIPHKLRLTMNRELKTLRYFSPGEVVDRTIFPMKDERYSFAISIVDDPETHIPQGKLGQFSSFYRVGDGGIYYERRYAGATCKLLITEIESDQIKVWINPTYLNLVRLKIDNLYPLGVHLTDILLMKMLRDGDLLVHGASLADDSGSSFLMIAPPDTGKTYTTFMLLKRGYKFLGEDLSYYDGKHNRIYCMPYTSTWGHRYSFKKFSVERVPIIGFLSPEDKTTVEDLVGRDAIAESGELDNIYLLEKGEGGVSRLSRGAEVLRKVMAIQRNEFSYIKNPLLRAYEYYHEIDVDKAADRERSLFERLLSDKKVYVVRAPSHEGFADLVHAHQSL